MRVLFSDEFKRRYERLPVSVQKKAEKQERVFRRNPFYPSLHTEKLEPRNKDTWSIRVDRHYRIFFKFIDGDTAYFMTVGPHDWIYKLNF